MIDYHNKMACWPWFSPQFRALAQEGWTKAIVPSGCGVDSGGNVACRPEEIRASAEVWLARNASQALATIGGRLSLDVYTFARYMHSEVGSGTVEERVAVGEAAVNQARSSGRSIYQMLTPTGYYGPIHAPRDWCLAHGYSCSSTSNPNVCCAPYKRWASTARDPSVMAILLAHLVVSGASGDFAQGAVTQWGPEAWINDGQAKLTGFVKNIASSSKYYWAGPLPGVDPWHTFLVRKEWFGPSTPMGSTLVKRGIEALTLPRRAPVWPADMAVCRKPLMSRRAQSFFVASLGLAVGAVGASLVARRYLHA
jgi:hypothetical protein